MVDPVASADFDLSVCGGSSPRFTIFSRLDGDASATSDLMFSEDSTTVDHERSHRNSSDDGHMTLLGSDFASHNGSRPRSSTGGTNHALNPESSKILEEYEAVEWRISKMMAERSRCPNVASSTPSCGELSERLHRTEDSLSKMLVLLASLPEQMQTRCGDLVRSTLAEVCQRVEDHTQDMSIRMEKLEAQGWVEKLSGEMDQRVKAHVADLQTTCTASVQRDSFEALVTLARSVGENEVKAQERYAELTEAVKQTDLDLNRRVGEGAQELIALRELVHRAQETFEATPATHGIDTLRKAHENGIEALKSVIEVCKESLENRYRDCARRTDSFAEKLRQTCESSEKHFVENEKAVASIQASLVAGEGKIAALQLALSQDTGAEQSSTPASRLIDKCFGLKPPASSPMDPPRRFERGRLLGEALPASPKRPNSVDRCGSSSPKRRSRQEELRDVTHTCGEGLRRERSGRRSTAFDMTRAMSAERSAKEDVPPPPRESLWQLARSGTADWCQKATCARKSSSRPKVEAGAWSPCSPCSPRTPITAPTVALDVGPTELGKVPGLYASKSAVTQPSLSCRTPQGRSQDSCRRLTPTRRGTLTVVGKVPRWSTGFERGGC